MVKRLTVRLLLGILNSRWLNSTPCRYEFVGNVDAFSYSNLASEDKQRPGITVKQILEEADRFRVCPMRKGGLTVMEPDGSIREADIWDIHELKQDLSKR